MAKKNINKRCPLSIECERKTCDFVNNEHKCDYYKYNARPGYFIPDQEEILELQRKQLDMDLKDDFGNNDLIYIPVTRLFAHPDNPRKDLGDLTELANSIKEKGIMQNLTVVPRIDNTYTVIIGHRRLAAAKAAGLTEVPCIITEMSPQEQVATMLLENMQRSDLTLYEQAQGFQMMIDFGENVETISQKTGLSESTVRRRVKLTKLNQDTLKKVSNRQISIGDLDRLNKIESEDERNKVLSHIGTNNFENELKKALDAQKTQKIIAKAKEAFANIDITEVQHRDYATQRYERCFYYETGLETGVEFVKELIANGKKCFIEYSKYGGYFQIYTEDAPATSFSNDNDNAEETEEQKQKRQEQERQEKLLQLKEIRRSALKEAFERAYCLRYEFLKKFTEAQAKEHIKEISIMMSRAIWSEFGVYDYDHESYMELMGLAPKEDFDSENYEEIEIVAESLPHKSLLINAYMNYGDDKRETCYTWSLNYEQNEGLEVLYECLKTIGYEMSDEEKTLLNGTNPLYNSENE